MIAFIFLIALVVGIVSICRIFSVFYEYCRAKADMQSALWEAAEIIKQKKFEEEMEPITSPQKIIHCQTNIEHIENYYDQRPSGSNTHAIPEVLQTDTAKQMWQKLQAVGYVNEQLQPQEGRNWAAMAIMAYEMGTALGQDMPFRPFEILWQHPGLSKNYHAAFDSNSKAGELAISIRELLKED